MQRDGAGSALAASADDAYTITNARTREIPIAGLGLRSAGRCASTARRWVVDREVLKFDGV